MGDMFFEHPYAFLIILFFIICARFCRARSESIIFPHLEIFIKSRSKSSFLLNALKWLSIIFIVIALASPVIENRLEVEKKDGYSIALVLDASGSMKFGFGDQYLGFGRNGTQSKFDISMQMAKEFVSKRKNDQIGLVVFGNFAYVATPLTYDKKILTQIMGTLRAGIAGPNYTVINDALFQSSKLFAKSKSKTKILILLTDGQSRGDNIPLNVAIRVAQEYGIKVYTIGIGNRGDFNANHLKNISEKTGGQFFSANDKGTLKKIYEKIDKLEKSEFESEKYVKKSYYYELPLFLGFMFLLFYAFVLNRRGVA
jgi:Ca-activated chloride channel family protein